MSDAVRPLQLTPVDFDPFAAADESIALTEPQREMCAATLMGDEANSSYNQCFVIRLHGPLVAESLRRALVEVVRRHEALRVAIDLENESQRVLDDVAVELPLLDLGAATADQREAKIAALVEHETLTPFDLGTSPLWRAFLVREAPDQHVFVFTAHHVVVDGWSSAVIFSDLAKAYVADRFGIPPSLPAAASYRDFVAEQRSPAVAAEMEAALKFWAAQYAAGVPSFELPLDRQRPAFKTYRAGREVLAIDKTLYQSVR
ncbi:MAG TPA: condensation domain-containing protein, partial [Rhodanobacteraceae bacterium]